MSVAIDKIIIKGAREHNLKNVDVEIPRDKLVVLTGLSGSGKSSLAFDTIYADGQRRYVESLSSYARHVFGPDGKAGCGLHRGAFSGHFHRPENHLEKPPFHRGHRDRDLRLPASAVCPHRHSPLSRCAAGRSSSRPSTRSWTRCWPCRREPRFRFWLRWCAARKGEHVKEFEAARKSGFVRVRVDGNLYDLSETISLEKNKKHTIEIVVDRLVIKTGDPHPAGGLH